MENPLSWHLKPVKFFMLNHLLMLVGIMLCITFLWNYLMMKKSRNFAKAPVVTEYEMEKFKTMKKNLECMKAKGCGTLAQKLLEANSNMYLANAGDEGFGSDDEEYMPNNEVEDDEDVTSSKVPIVKPTLKSRSSKRRCMADYLPKQQPQPNQQQNDHDQQPNQRGPNHHTREPDQQKNGHSELHKAHQTPLQRQSKKKMCATYCSPGSMAAFLNLRRKQMEAATRAANKGNENAASRASNECNELALNEVHENAATNYSNDLQLQQRCDELAESEPQRTNTTAESSAPKKKGRGPTLLTHVHKRTMSERPVIILNCYGQPIGPTKKLVSEYSLFLGTLARNSEYLLLNYCDWPSVPENAKSQVWDYVQSKYLVSSEGRDWALETIGCQWRGWKCRSKALYYYSYATYEERWKNRPNTIPENQFKELLYYWDDEGTQEESERNSSNRQSASDMHTMGPTSYAYMREQLKQEDPNKEDPPKAKVYIHSRKRKPGKSYKTSFDEVAANIEQMEAIQSQQCEGSNHKDPYGDVIKKPEHSGRVRTFGKGVTMTDLKNGGKSSSYIFPQEYLQSMQSQVVDQLLQANPELQKLLEANPGVKIVLPSMSRSGSNVNPQNIDSHENNSMGAHSENQLDHVEPSDGKEVENDDIEP